MTTTGFFAFGSGMMLFPILLAILIVIPVWQICAKAGYSGWLGLLVLVPIVNLVLLYFLAFSEWPIERRRTTDRLES